MLSFSLINEGKGIQIECDGEGASVLLKTLADLIGEHAGHRHLRTPDCGGKELNSITPWRKPAVSEVIIDYVECVAN